MLMLKAGAGLPAAVNVTTEVEKADLAVTVFTPALVPRRRVVDALHCASTAAEVGFTLPPPLAAANVTIIPGLQGEKRTTSGVGSIVSTTLIC